MSESERGSTSKGSQLLASGKELFSKLPRDLNSLRQQTTPLLYRHEDTLKLQLYIRSLKGVCEGVANLARSSQLASKSLFEWAQHETADDLVDIFDRAAFLEYRQSEVELECATKLERARLLVKDVRNSENELANRRKHRHQLAAKLDQLKGKDPRVPALEAELAQVDADIASATDSLSALKRDKFHESFEIQFAAHKERGAKLAIISAYGELLIRGMETDGIESDYIGRSKTAQIKAQLERALDGWTPPPPPVLESSDSSSLDRSDTRSFGATHADQLSQLGSSDVEPPLAPAASGTLHDFVPPLETIPATPLVPPGSSSFEAPTDSQAVPSSSLSRRAVPPVPPTADRSPFRDPPSSSSSSSPPRLPPRRDAPSGGGMGHTLNLSPTPPDLGSTFVRPDPSSSSSSSSPPAAAKAYPVPNAPEGVTPPEPTVAETGQPRVGTGGPSSGQLVPRGGPGPRPPRRLDDESGSSASLAASGPEMSSSRAGGGEGGRGGGGARGSSSSEQPRFGRSEEEEEEENQDVEDDHDGRVVDAAVVRGGHTLSMPGSLPGDEAGWERVSSNGGYEQGVAATRGGGGAGRNERLPGYGEGDVEAQRANDEAERILAAERDRKAMIESGATD